MLLLTSHLSQSVGCCGFHSSLSSAPCVPKPSGALWVTELQVGKVAKLLSVDRSSILLHPTCELTQGTLLTVS
jgi:hypothetical protein